MTRSMPSQLESLVEVVRYDLRRQLRTRRTWLAAGVPALLLLLLGVSRELGQQTATDAWRGALTTAGLGFVGYFVPLLFLASTLADEQAERTLAYQLVRPIARPVLLLAKYLAGVSLALLVSVTYLGLAFLLAHLGAFDIASASELGRGLAAMALVVVGHGAIATCYGALSRGASASLTVVHFAVLELGMSKLPGRFPLLSMHAHALRVAGTGVAPEGLVEVPVAGSVGFVIGAAVLALVVAGVVISQQEQEGGGG